MRNEGRLVLEIALTDDLLTQASTGMRNEGRLVLEIALTDDLLTQASTGMRNEGRLVLEIALTDDLLTQPSTGMRNEGRLVSGRFTVGRGIRKTRGAVNTGGMGRARPITLGLGLPALKPTAKRAKGDDLMANPPSALEALRVDLAALRRRGTLVHPVEAVLPRAWLAGVLRDTDAEISGDAEVRLRVTLQPKDVVLVQGSLSLQLTVPCGRCLAPAAVDGSTTLFATFMASAAAAQALLQADEDLLEPDVDAPDVFVYDGSTLALDAMVAEQVALAYPMRALCERGQACRGLCSNCGCELNGLPDDERCCPQCGHEVPLTPVADLPEAETGEPGEPEKTGETPRGEREGPLAAALRKLALE
jgi:uncharacterized metal-binding protein YceD (DUF177 family)